MVFLDNTKLLKNLILVSLLCTIYDEKPLLLLKKIGFTLMRFRYFVSSKSKTIFAITGPVFDDNFF